MKRSIILENITALIFPFIILYGIYVILNGHLSPGGGFSGGSIVGAALILFRTVFGAQRIERVITFGGCVKASSLALLFYALVKGWSFFTGANLLPSGVPLGTPGSIFSGGLILPLNISVGLIVACTMYMFYNLFEE